MVALVIRGALPGRKVVFTNKQRWIA